jgi:hypothetical protein
MACREIILACQRGKFQLKRPSRQGDNSQVNGQPLQGAGIGGRHRAASLGFDQAHPAGFGGDDEIHLETLLIPKPVELTPPPSVELRFEDFTRQEALEGRAQNRRLLQETTGPRAAARGQCARARS